MARFLDEKLTDREIARVELAAIAALKTFDPPLQSLEGQRVAGVSRRGKYLLFDVSLPDQQEHRWLVVHLARAGWIRWRDDLPSAAAKPGKGPLALRVGLSHGGGIEITEAGTEKRLALWLVRSLAEIEPLSQLGVDPLDPGMTLQEFEARLSSRAGNVKGALTDQSLLAGIGNAYSDEILHEARLSPFKPAGKLDKDEVRGLHEAVRSVLSAAVERSAGLPASGLKKEKRSGMMVHGRTGDPCPDCGDLVREVVFSSRSLQYCPTCQTGGRVLADRRLSRLLK